MNTTINKADELRYKKALEKIGHKNLLDIPEPFRTQLKNCTDLHEKSLLLEKLSKFYQEVKNYGKQTYKFNQ